eukprot:5982285-Amphidinium_carterae.4
MSTASEPLLLHILWNKGPLRADMPIACRQHLIVQASTTWRGAKDEPQLLHGLRMPSGFMLL